ncbi:hypothetical protein B0I35DRAFT_104453 [Stachybotrys elegans]|uniref:Secreted protein n=1 Tax=Stachybotrys elegans TaxID=80388 RepID=A0A8K0SF34_9HYPO|nr:hypothetical protein B0I35DRAFT_104453 [Stachybotrys elegans]
MSLFPAFSFFSFSFLLQVLASCTASGPIGLWASYAGWVDVGSPRCGKSVEMRQLRLFRGDATDDLTIQPSGHKVRQERGGMEGGDDPASCLERRVLVLLSGSVAGLAESWGEGSGRMAKTC